MRAFLHVLFLTDGQELFLENIDVDMGNFLHNVRYLDGKKVCLYWTRYHS